MPDHPLYVAILWHMHQPYYRDLRRAGQIDLPWVRLHAAKDYLHMAEVLARFPAVHLTINMVPSLVEQMVAWAAGHESDRLVALAERDQRTDEDKRFILSLAFSISWDRVIRKRPRYAELLDRRAEALLEPGRFSEADYTDLLAWFNLSWFDLSRVAQDADLAALITRGSQYTVADLRLIHARQRKMAASVLPLYRRLVEQGQLEVCTSPYFHPILPLLEDVAIARRPSPGLPLPAISFTAPEDAAAQLEAAVESHTRSFGAPPAGLWPSEGAVSPEILPLARAAGFRWLASDEAVLGASLGRPFQRDDGRFLTDPRALYQPYRALADGDLGPYMIFRDHELSDRIGFLYQYLPAAQAADDLIYRLLEIRRRLDDPGRPYLVSIILDGENAWEHYEENGDPFLDALYGGLSQRPELKAVTVSDYLADRRPLDTLARLASGSWIGGDFTTWIGDPEHNRAWEALARTRAHLVEFARQNPSHARLGSAWQALYAAEGSDWFWWYSRRNSSHEDALFDRLFRDDLASVWEALGEAAPAWLSDPIFEQARARPGGLPAAGFCSPVLTAAPFAGNEWALAGVLEPASLSTGPMQLAGGRIGRLLVGHDERSLLLRLDLRDPMDNFETAIYLGDGEGLATNQRIGDRYPDRSGDRSGAHSDLALTWQVRRSPGQASPFLFKAAGGDQWESVAAVMCALGERVLELSLPLPTLGLAVGEEVSVLVTLARRGAAVTRLPEAGMARFVLQPAV